MAEQKPHHGRPASLPEDQEQKQSPISSASMTQSDWIRLLREYDTDKDGYISYSI